MGDDKRAIVVTQQPEKEVYDRTLALASQSMKKIDEESAEVPSEDGEEPPTKKKRSKKTLCVWCCLLAAVLLLLLAIIIVILVFTVFKPKNPTVTVTKTNLTGVNFNPVPGINQKVSFSAELDTNASVHNPNTVAFKYSSTTIYISYHGKQIAEAPVAAAEIKAKRTIGIFLPVQVSLSDDNLNGDLANDLRSGKLPLVSTVTVTGTIKFGLIKIKNVRVKSQCNLTYFLIDQRLSSDCQASTKI